MVAVALEGCPKGNSEVAEGKKAEAIQDYDTALVHYERALRADPTNAEFKLYAQQARYDAGQFHVRQGQKAVKAGDLQLGLAEFQKAQLIDPSNQAADQEVKRTMDLMLAQSPQAQRSQTEGPAQDEQVLSGPPELKPLSREPINLKRFAKTFACKLQQATPALLSVRKPLQASLTKKRKLPLLNFRQ